MISHLILNLTLEGYRPTFHHTLPQPEALLQYPCMKAHSPYSRIPGMFTLTVPRSIQCAPACR